MISSNPHYWHRFHRKEKRKKEVCKWIKPSSLVCPINVCIWIYRKGRWFHRPWFFSQRESIAFKSSKTTFTLSKCREGVLSVNFSCLQFCRGEMGWENILSRFVALMFHDSFECDEWMLYSPFFPNEYFTVYQFLLFVAHAFPWVLCYEKACLRRYISSSCSSSSCCCCRFLSYRTDYYSSTCIRLRVSRMMSFLDLFAIRLHCLYLDF